MNEPGTVDIFKALSDEVRLRILRAALSSELSVAELVTVLGLPQSTVSRHLKPLRESGLVASRRDGTSVYYRRGPALDERALDALLETRLKTLPGASEEHASVRRVLDARRSRSRAFFDHVAGSYASLTQPGGGWQPLATGLAVGFAGRDIADLGAGEGALTLLLARYAASVTAIDQSPKMLRLVEERAIEAGLADRVRVAEGDLEALPLPDAALDAAFLGQALHHASRPEHAVREAARILKAGGWLVLLDLVKHEQEWVRDEWADQWLGFEENEVRGWMESAGLDVVQWDRLSGSAPELSVMVAVGRRRQSMST